MIRRAVLTTCIVAWAGAANGAMLDPHAFDPAKMLPPPPAAGSQQAGDEMAELKAIAARSTPQQVAVAAKDAKDEKPDMFNGALGFDITKYPVTTALLAGVVEEEEVDSKFAKEYFHRERPYAVDRTLKTCVPVKPGKSIYSSYPSGHATLAFTLAEVLAQLFPQKSQAILARASQFAENRLVCQVHFRSDIAAGQQFGTILALRLMALPAFRERMEAARSELRAANLMK
ncbi:MAG: phosphatase PAP2 family protein [Alphaproteobacteria bacterium]|nr:phosphatase PAP2 family protein [Alphaproteobacteria bacterium]